MTGTVKNEKLIWIESMGDALVRGASSCFSFAALYIGVPLGPISATEFQAILDSLTDAFVVVDRQWRYLCVNRPAAALIGKDRADVVGKKVWDLFPELIGTLVYTELQQAMETREVRRVDFYVAGQWYHNAAYPCDQGLIIMFWNVTDRKRSEDLAAIRATELETIYREAPIGLCTLDTQLHYTHINDRLAELNGIPGPDHVGRTPREIVPHLADQVEPLLRKVLETGEPFVAVEIHGETPARPGEPRTWRVSYFPIRTVDGKIIIGINVVVEDVTDQLRSQQQLRALAAELSRTEDRERKRLATAIHDNFSQLLAVSLIRLDAIAQKKDIGEVWNTVKDVKDQLNEALIAARTLTEDLRPPLLGHEDDLKAALTWVAGKMHRHGLFVSLRDHGEPKVVEEDVLIITYQAVQELLWNVIKHAGTTEASVCIDRSGEHAEIVVEDHGKGFEPSRLRKPENQGFGLLSIQERLGLIGGRLEMTSAPRSGTRARITVPLRSSAMASAKGQPTTVSPAVAGIPFLADMQRRIRVLIVDDHPVMRQGLRHLVEDQRDMTVVAEAGDGQAAVQLARETAPDVVLMDVNLPIMNGIEATREIKTQQPGVTVICLSMHDVGQMAEAMAKAGADLYLSKGEAANTLCAAIRSCKRHSDSGTA